MRFVTVIVLALLVVASHASAQTPNLIEGGGSLISWNHPVVFVNGGYDRQASVNAGAEVWFPSPMPHTYEVIVSADVNRHGALKLTTGFGSDAEGDLLAADVRGIVYAHGIRAGGLEAGVSLLHLRVSGGYVWTAGRGRPTFSISYRRLVFSGPHHRVVPSP